ncbi:hypothetical protein PIB30_101033, partial [Stylosanthes scabra]|nr:hypothetical protein [Stylosanthes scabra]
NNPGKVAVEELDAQAPRATRPGAQSHAQVPRVMPRRQKLKSRRGTQSLGAAKLIPSIQSPRLGARSSSLGMGTLKVQQPSPVFTKTHA